MSREYIPWIGVVIALLIGGLLMGQQLLAPSHDADGVAVPAGDDGAFRQWLWESRSLDLAVQVGLIFVGALGIAALLPRSREEE